MSVYKRGNRWYYYIKIKGARYRGAVPEARTKYQAQEAERQVRNQIFEGKYGAAQSNKTVRQFVEEVYLPWAKENKRSWRNDFSRIKPILAYFGKRKMAEVSPFEVERFKVTRSKTITLRGTARKRASVNREIALLSRVFSLAISKREISVNPVKEVKLFKGEDRRTRYLTPEEEEQLMSAIGGGRTHLRLIVLIALNTGMRRGEILRLTKSNLDFSRGEIHATQTKNGEDRAIPINSRLRLELRSHLDELKGEHLFANPKTGKPFVSIQRAFETAARVAGIADFRFHDLRHTAATRMGEAGIDPFTIAAILGHKRIAMTASYTHATEAAKRRAVEALSGAAKQSGPQIGHRQQRQSMMAVAK